MKKQRSRALRALGCALLIILCFTIESSLSVRFSVLGQHVDLLPPMTAAAGILLGSPAGMLCGLVCGILYDAFGAQLEGLYPLFYMVCGIAAGVVAQSHPRWNRIALTAASSAVMSVVLSVLRFLFYYQFVLNVPLTAYLVKIVIQAVIAAIAALPAYAIVRLTAGDAVVRPEQDDNETQGQYLVHREMRKSFLKRSRVQNTEDNGETVQDGRRDGDG